MQILVFSTDDFLPPAGGAETAFWEIARRNSQHRFTLVCARLERARSRRQTVENVSIRRIGIGHRRVDPFLLAFFGVFVALGLQWRHRCALAWAVMASYGAAGATLFSWATGTPLLLTLQEGNDVERGVRTFPLLQQIYRLGFRSADGLQAISRYLLDWGHRMGFRRDRPAELIPNGVDIALFTAPVAEQMLTAERSTYHVPLGSFVITTVSRLVPKNGIDDLIRALALLPNRFALVIHGYGPMEQKLKELARSLGVAERVRFMGHLPRERLPAALRAADVFARPSLTEGLGTAFLEAMAAGVPVVATPVGGIVDFLRDGENGFLTPPREPERLAHTLQRVAGMDAERRAALAARARETVVRTYDWDVIARRMNALFQRLAHRT